MKVWSFAVVYILYHGSLIFTPFFFFYPFLSFLVFDFFFFLFLRSMYVCLFFLFLFMIPSVLRVSFPPTPLRLSSPPTRLYLRHHFWLISLSSSLPLWLSGSLALWKPLYISSSFLLFCLVISITTTFFFFFFFFRPLERKERKKRVFLYYKCIKRENRQRVV